MAFRHLFVPHRSNKSHPHALRPIGLTASLIAVILLVFVSPQVSQSAHVLGYATSVSVGEVYSLSNQERTQRGLPAYGQNGLLAQAAQAKAQDMFAKNYWAHASPDGTQPWAFIAATGYSYSAAGENLAKDFNTSAGVVAGWMGSATHQANVLSGTYKEVGYAVMNGTLQGQPTTLVVAMYAAPAAGAAAAATPTPPAPVKPKPTPAPAPAPVPIPAPEPVVETPAPAPTSTEPVVESASVTTPQQSRYQITSPQSAYKLLNWDQKATVLVLATLAFLFLLKHTLIWRQQKRGYQHIWLRAHPLAQASLLLLGILVVISSGAGVVL